MYHQLMQACAHSLSNSPPPMLPSHRPLRPIGGGLGDGEDGACAPGAGRFLEIQQAIEPNRLNPRAGSSLLCLAAKEDAVDLMRCLTSRWQIDPNQRAGDSATPLWAAISARKETASLFLSMRRSASTRTCAGPTARPP